MPYLVQLSFKHI